MVVMISAIEVKALMMQLSFGRLWVRRKGEDHSVEKQFRKRKGDAQTDCASGDAMTLRVREKERKDERNESRRELICCHCWSWF